MGKEGQIDFGTSGNLVISGDGGGSWNANVQVVQPETVVVKTLEIPSSTVPSDRACTLCAKKANGSFVFTDENKSDFVVCTNCMKECFVWALAQKRGGSVPVPPEARRSPCEKCGRIFPREHLSALGKDSPMILCDPCRTQFLEEAVQAHRERHTRNIVL